MLHHISSRHLRHTSTVRKYIRYIVAYVTRPHELTFRWTRRNPSSGKKPRAGTKNESKLILGKEENLNPY